MPVGFETPKEHPGVAIVTIDRPEKANSLSLAMLRDLAQAWRRIAEDGDIRCAVVTGGGDRVFCSGMDMKETIPVSQKFARGERVEEEEFEGLRSVATALLAGFDLETPLIAAINGHCRAGGFDMMLATDMRVSVPGATFALEEVALGLYPTGNTTVLLPKQIGWVRANELMLTAKPVSAETALEWGLVNRIVEPEQLMPAALELADAVAGNAPLAVRETRRGVREIIHLSLEDGYKTQEAIGRELRKTEDAREAQRAFAEKRKPVWKGR